MCLRSYTSVPLITKKDIKVYKRLEKVGKKTFTPYQKFPMKEGWHYLQKGENKFTIFPAHNAFSIYKGLHSYTSLKTAKNNVCYNEIIVEMIVPKGSEYFISINGREICSDNLIWYKGAKIYKN